MPKDDPRYYWGDAFVPLGKSFFAIALYRLADRLASIADLGSPTPIEIVLIEAEKMFWDGVLAENAYNVVVSQLEPYLDKKSEERWKEVLRQRHIKMYGREPGA